MATFRPPLIAKIHVGKNQLGLDDDTYRALLQMTTGKTSCKAMSSKELESVLAAMKERGFEPAAQKRGRYSPASRSKRAQDKSPLDKLRALWIQMGKDGYITNSSEAALILWAKRQTNHANGGIGVDSLEWLAQDSKMLQQVIEALKGWRNRLQRAS